MKLIVDAQLPNRLRLLLQSRGHDAIHTLDLPEANRTTDKEICRLCEAEDRVLITKDNDFVVSRLATGLPRRLLLVSTGNITNDKLISLFDEFLGDLEEAFDIHSFVEFSKELLVIHD